MSASYTINTPGGNPTMQAPAPLHVTTVSPSGAPQTNQTQQAPPPVNLTTQAQAPTTTAVPFVWGKITGDIQQQLDLQQEFALQAGIALANLTAHTSNHNNPHVTTAAQVGLGNVANLSPDNLPISTATAAAIAAVAATVPTTPIPVAQGGTGAVNAANARTNLGASAPGATIFTSATANGASITTGASTVGVAVAQASTQAAARGAIGSGAFGDSLFLTATQAAALQALGWSLGAPQPVGQCYMTLASTTSILLVPQDGNQLFINGSYRTIPSAGVSIAPGAFPLVSGGATYNIYAMWNGTAIVLEAANVARATDTTYGHQIKSGDPTRTLVGKAWYNNGGTFDFGLPTSVLLYISWFNRRRRVASVTYPASGSPNYATTISPVDIATIPGMGGQNYFLSWGVDASVTYTNGPVNLGAAGIVYFFNVGFFNSLNTSVIGGSSASYYQNPVNASNWYNYVATYSFLVPDNLGAASTGLSYQRGSTQVWSNGVGSTILFAGPNGSNLSTEIWG